MFPNHGFKAPAKESIDLIFYFLEDKINIINTGSFIDISEPENVELIIY